MKYNKELINEAFDVKEKLEGKDKKVIENLIGYVNEIYSKANLEEGTKTKTMQSVIDINTKDILSNGETIYFNDEEKEKLRKENEKLKLKLKKTDRRKRYLGEILKQKKNEVEERKEKDNVMEFQINGKTWTISEEKSDFLLKEYKKENDDDDIYFIHGLTKYALQKIYINNEQCFEQKISTLKHELTHCYIKEYGLYNIPNYNEEMVCDLVASINDFITNTVEKWKEFKSKDD